MLEVLCSWKFWVFVAIVILVLVWLFSNFERKSPEKKIQKRRKGILKKRYTKSPRDYVVSEEEVSEYVESEISKSVLESFAESEHQERSFAKPLPEQFCNDELYEEESSSEFERVEREKHQDILDPKRPESTRKMTGKETKGEKLCKEAAEKIYGVTFHRSVWPDWLRNPETGRAMELDLYNEDLQIAIEYNGIQHYKYTPYFHRNGIRDFESQVRRDQHKLDICDKKGVYVITVPYYVPDNKIEDWIRYYDPVSYALREARKAQLN